MNTFSWRKIAAPLTGFHSQEKDILLAGGYRIREASTDEKKLFKNTENGECILQPSDEFFLVEKEIDIESHTELFGVFDIVILGISLVKDYLIVEIPAFIFSYEDGRQIVMTRDVGFYGNNECILTGHELQEFSQLFTRLLDRQKSFLVPIERFIRAQQNIWGYEHSSTDSLVDMVIAFEALILRDQKTRHKGIYLAKTISNLIGKDDEDRKKIEENLLLAYQTRNKIVHGSLSFSKPEGNEHLSLLREEIADYFKRALRKVL